MEENNEKKVFMKKILVIISISVICLCICFYLFWTLVQCVVSNLFAAGYTSYKGEKAVMKYLETKYGTDQEFNIIGVRGGGIGDHYHVSEITANDLKERESFDVFYKWNKEEKKVEVEYDTYIATRYKKKVDEFFAEKIKEIINKEIIDSDVYVDSFFSYDSDNNYIKFEDYLVSKDTSLSLKISIDTDLNINIINKRNIMNLLISEFEKMGYITRDSWHIQLKINGVECVSIKVPGEEPSYREM